MYISLYEVQKVTLRNGVFVKSGGSYYLWQDTENHNLQ